MLGLGIWIGQPNGAGSGGGGVSDIPDGAWLFADGSAILLADGSYLTGV